MGRDKARLLLRGTEMAGAVAGEVRRAVGNVTLVGHPELPGIPDRYPGEGPLGGILTALHATKSEWNLIVACDMPEVSAEFLQWLIGEADRVHAAIVMPCGAEDRPEPLCALYHRDALESMEAAFGRGVRKVTAAMEGVPVALVHVGDPKVFQNVNTPEDWSGYAAE
jgi:molybdopterin-guanine dinucleotide biosynthesis protein A